MTEATKKIAELWNFSLTQKQTQKILKSQLNILSINQFQIEVHLHKSTLQK